MTADLARRIATAERGYVVEADGLYLVDEGSLTDADWVAIGVDLVRARDANQWALGDWILAALGPHRGGHGDKYSRAIEVTGFSYRHVQKLSMVAEAFPRTERVNGLRWTHHRLAITLPQSERAPMLFRAKTEVWSTGRMLEEVDAANRRRRIVTMEPAPRRRPAKNVRKVKCPNCQHEFPVRGNEL